MPLLPPLSYINAESTQMDVYTTDGTATGRNVDKVKVFE